MNSNENSFSFGDLNNYIDFDPPPAENKISQKPQLLSEAKSKSTSKAESMSDEELLELLEANAKSREKSKLQEKSEPKTEIIKTIMNEYKLPPSKWGAMSQAEIERGNKDFDQNYNYNVEDYMDFEFPPKAAMLKTSRNSPKNNTIAIANKKKPWLPPIWPSKGGKNKKQNKKTKKNKNKKTINKNRRLTYKKK